MRYGGGVKSTLVAVAVCGSLALAACSKPKPPVLTPKETRVTAIDGKGITFLARVDAFNPNGFDLTARSMTAHVILEGGVDLGTVTAPNGVSIPAGGHAEITAPLQLQWQGMSTVAQLAATGKPIPYKVEGTVTLGSERFNVDVPFSVGGTITREQILGAALKAIPPLPLPH